VIYTSDHGESIEQTAHLHGTPKDIAPPEQLMVPMIIWESKSFLSNPRNAQGFAGLRARRAGWHLTMTFLILYWAALGLNRITVASIKAGIFAPAIDPQAHNSLFFGADGTLEFT